MLQRLFDLRPALTVCVTSDAWFDFRNKQSVNKREKLIDPCKQLVLNDNYWDTVASFLLLLDGVIRLLRLVDGNVPCIASIIPSFLSLTRDLNSLSLKENTLDDVNFQTMCKELQIIVKNRWQYMKHPIYSAAYCLSPRYAGKHLLNMNNNYDMLSDVTLILRRYTTVHKCSTTDLLLEYASFRGAQGALLDKDILAVAQGSSEKQAMLPHLWWQSFGGCWPLLQPIAIKILSKVPSSSPCERVECV